MRKAATAVVFFLIHKSSQLGVAALPRNIKGVIFPKRQFLDYLKNKSFARH